jgi:hypothetical protein
MKTPIELAIEVIADLPTEVLNASSIKQVFIGLLKQAAVHEREHLTLAFMEGQSTPKASFEMWFNKKYKKTERTSDDSE